MTDLSHLSAPGTEIAVRVTPKASRNTIVAEDGAIRATPGMKYLSDLSGSALPDSPYF